MRTERRSGTCCQSDQSAFQRSKGSKFGPVAPAFRLRSKGLWSWVLLWSKSVHHTCDDLLMLSFWKHDSASDLLMKRKNYIVRFVYLGINVLVICIWKYYNIFKIKIVLPVAIVVESSWKSMKRAASYFCVGQERSAGLPRRRSPGRWFHTGGVKEILSTWKIS